MVEMKVNFSRLLLQLFSFPLLAWVFTIFYAMLFRTEGNVLREYLIFLGISLCLAVILNVKISMNIRK